MLILMVQSVIFVKKDIIMTILYVNLIPKKNRLIIVNIIQM